MKIFRIIFFIFFPLTGFSFQELPVKDLNQRLNDFYAKKVQLKIHLFLNQEKYAGGDTIFFKAWALHANSLQRLERNTILNVLLLDKDKNILVSEKIRLIAGERYNQIAIPVSVVSGRYVLVAYHDWIANSSPDLFHQQYVDIVGEKEFQLNAEERELNFYPEGGKLIAQANSKVVVSGKPLKDGRVITAAGTEVSRFTTDENGYGFFYLKPEKDQTYAVEIENVKTSLPISDADGVSVFATVEKDGSQVRVIIQPASASAFSKVRLVVDNQSDIFYSATVKIDQEYAMLNIPLGDVPPGIARLSVLSENGRLLSERLLFVNSISKIDPVIDLSKSIFGPREKVTLSFKLTDSERGPAPAKLAVTVFKKTSEEKHFARGITSDLLLFSDLKGTLTRSNLLFNPEDVAWLKKIDNYLITQKWIRAPWDEVIKEQKTPPFYYSTHFTGDVVNNTTGAPIMDSTFVTFFLQKNVMTYQTFAHNGKFDMPLFMDFFGEEEVYYRIERRGKPIPEAKIVIREFPALDYSVPSTIPTQKNETFFAQKQERKLIDESFGFFRKPADYKNISEANAQIEEEIFGPDVTIDLDKYMLLPTMEEILREIVPMVQHRRIKNESIVRVYFNDIDRQATESPLYIIDGVMTDDTDFFMKLKTSDVSKIKVINTRDKLKVFGAIGRGGVILVDTKIPDHSAKVPKSRNSFTVHGLSETVPVRKIDPTLISSRIPDLRTNLLWAPEIVTDENGDATISFFTSDVTGDFEIHLEGLTNKGIPFQKEGNFKVEFRPVSN